MKLLSLALFFATFSAASEVAQCIELPYPAMPKQLWERELVWMKNIGATCVALPNGPDLSSLLIAARKLELPVWVLTAGAMLEPQTESHGGPIRWLGKDAVPQPVCKASAIDPKALALTRACLETHQGTVLWTDVESTITPAFHRGAISFRGVEQPTLAALRREVNLFQEWQPLFGQIVEEQPIHLATGKLPTSVTARQFFTSDAVPISAVSLVNQSAIEFVGELRVQYPPLKQSIRLPAVNVPAGEALWLPVNLPIAKARRCQSCNGFANDETIVYATAELTAVEFENGTLALEFSAPQESEVVLHLAAEPVGPYLAAGVPRKFDWDAGSGRARLVIPAGKGPTHRVRVGIALTEPETSAFFGETKVLLIGQKNTVSTQYSSEAVAGRSRLIAPAWLKTTPATKTPNEIEYSFIVPASALHGSHVELALETDGTQINHARYQLLRPVSLRIREAINRHYGNDADLLLDPPLIPLDQKAGRDLNITVRNNAPEIRTFTIEASGEGVDFAQPKVEVVVAASAERDISFHVFADHSAPGLHNAKLKVSGAASYETDLRLLVIPRAETFRYTEGPFTILESQKARAIFTADRWMEFVWKDDERNVIPEGGLALGAAHPAELRGASLTIEGGPLLLKPGKQGEITIGIAPNAQGQTVYSLSR